MQIGLIKTYVSKYDFNNNSILAGKIKNFPIEIEGIAKIDEAISTIGGIDLKEITPDFK